MKPVEATWEGRGVRRGGGYHEPFVLLEPPAHNPGCSCVLGLTDSSGTLSNFSCFTAGCPPDLSCPPGTAWTPLDSLDATALCLFFMPDPRLMRQQSQRSVCTSLLRALMLWTSSIH